MTDVDILLAAEVAAQKFVADSAAGKTEADSDEAATRAFWSLKAPHTKQLLFRYHFAVCLLRLYQQEDAAG